MSKLALTVPLLAILSGCSVYNRAAKGVEDCFVWLTLDHQYRRAMRDFRQEKYDLASGELENLVDRMPGTKRRQNILSSQGVSHYNLKNYHEANDAFGRYLTAYAEGPHAPEASQYQIRIAVEREAPNPAAAEQLEQAKKDLASLMEIEAGHPTDPEVKYLMGNILYELGQYDLAGEKYYEAQKLEAIYQEKELIKKRLIINADGLPEVMTPATLSRLEREQNPVVVFDVFPYYRRRGSDFSAELVYQNITGKVRNQGTQTLRNVELEVRFLNSVNQALDIETISIGRLDPGQVRAFLARADDYDNLFNIVRVDVISRWN